MMAFTGMMVLVTFVIGAVGASGLEVQTASNVSLVSGKEATLPCRYNRSVFAVYWRYKSPSSPLELLVALDKHYQVGERSGPGYEEGRFNITDDYSLTIHKVQADDDGEYICEVSDFITGRALRNNTVASVIVIAEHPFPRIHQCEATSDEKTEPCSLHIYQDQPTELTCSVTRVKPKIELAWTSPDLGGRVINASMKEENAGDGIFDQSATLVIDTSQRFDKRRFICTADGLAVDGIATQTITIYFTKIGPFTGAIVGWTFLVVAVFVIIAGVIWWRRRKYLKTVKRTPALMSQLQVATEIGKKRTYIKEYPSKKAMKGEDSQNITLGIFGLAKSGKSTLINNMFLAVKGFYPTEKDGGATAAVGDDEEVRLTNQIKILNYKGKVNDNPNQMQDLFDQIVEKWGPSTENQEQTKIHLPIFVFDHSRSDMDQTTEFLKSLCEKVCRFFGREPMVVITNKGELGRCSMMKAELVKATGMQKDHIFIFENYTLDDAVVRTWKLLDFVKRCIKEAEKNTLFREKNKKEDETCEMPPLHIKLEAFWSSEDETCEVTPLHIKLEAFGSSEA